MSRRAARFRAELRRELDRIEAEEPPDVADALFRMVLAIWEARRAVQESRQ